MDRSFLEDMENNAAKSGIVKCIIELARNLNLKVKGRDIPPARSRRDALSVGATIGDGTDQAI